VEAGGGQASESNRQPGLARLNTSLAHVYEVVSAADAAPTTQALAASEQLQQSLSEALSRWNQLKAAVTSLNQQLQSVGASIDLNKPTPPSEDGGGEDEP
jgi:hypothetical protein